MRGQRLRRDCGSQSASQDFAVQSPMERRPHEPRFQAIVIGPPTRRRRFYCAVSVKVAPGAPQKTGPSAVTVTLPALEGSVSVTLALPFD